MDYYQKLGIERVIAAEGLAPEDLRFIGMIDFLGKDMRVRKIKRIGLDNLLYEMELARKMNSESVNGLFREHCFPKPAYFSDIVVRDDLRNYIFIFEINGHSYRIIVENPQQIN